MPRDLRKDNFSNRGDPPRHAVVREGVIAG